jgi:CspA family cold shock protein
LAQLGPGSDITLYPVVSKSMPTGYRVAVGRRYWARQVSVQLGCTFWAIFCSDQGLPLTFEIYVQNTHSETNQPCGLLGRRTSSRMARGRIKWYSGHLGYGFIIPNDEGVEVFVRQANIAEGNGFKSLENGAKVIYEVVWGREGPEAKNVSEV